jgi:hypothetical protein
MIQCSNCGQQHEDDLDVQLCHHATAYAAYAASLTDDELNADYRAELANERAIEWRNHWATL